MLERAVALVEPGRVAKPSGHKDVVAEDGNGPLVQAQRVGESGGAG
jgi:hypothetical protein